MTKTELVAGLEQEDQQWLALLDQIGPAHMDQPGAAGHWSIKDIVAHLTGWRRRTVARLQAAGRGDPEPPPPWPAHLQTDDEINAWIFESNHGRTVSEVLADSDRVFQQLLTAIRDLPDHVVTDPARHLSWWNPWINESNEGRTVQVGSSMSARDYFAHFHDEHEPDMRAWLARIEKQ